MAKDKAGKGKARKGKGAEVGAAEGAGGAAAVAGKGAGRTGLLDRLTMLVLVAFVVSEFVAHL